MTTTLVIFTWNEITAVRKIWPQIPRDKVNEILVVDGGSTDGTIEFFKNVNIPVYLQEKPGHGEAYKLGMKKAKGEVLVFFGCDGNNRPEDIPSLIRAIEDGKDLVIATRFGKGAHSNDATFSHRLGNYLFVWLVNARWNARVSDVFNEFRAIKKVCMERLDLKNSYFDLELEMTLKAIKQGLVRGEVSTVEEVRIGGVAKLKAIKDGLMNLRCFLKEAIGF
ncbi:MAG: glycosyltransferase family 2 protein, partial [Candidatus Omnitrophica bacterium]|nr:glycosyltransferase family 2 protein [Candidatus Omnitrophota bacterium]